MFVVFVAIVVCGGIMVKRSSDCSRRMCDIRLNKNNICPLRTFTIHSKMYLCSECYNLTYCLECYKWMKNEQILKIIRNEST